MASFRVFFKSPELYDPVTDELTAAPEWRVTGEHMQLPIHLAPNASLFVIFRKPTRQIRQIDKNKVVVQPVQTLEGPWQVQFDTTYGGPEQQQTFAQLTDWSQSADSSIRYYSGTATYTKTFTWSSTGSKRVWLDLGRIANVANVTLNGVSCGTVWTAPYRIDISKFLRSGQNRLAINVSNTWANRLIGDQRLPESKRITRTTAPFRLQGKPLLEAGLLGPVRIMTKDLQD